MNIYLMTMLVMLFSLYFGYIYHGSNGSKEVLSMNKVFYKLIAYIIMPLFVLLAFLLQFFTYVNDTLLIGMVLLVPIIFYIEITVIKLVKRKTSI